MDLTRMDLPIVLASITRGGCGLIAVRGPSGDDWMVMWDGAVLPHEGQWDRTQATDRYRELERMRKEGIL